MQEERWLPVVGFQGLYAVSDLGRVKSLARTAAVSGGGQRPIRERILKTATDRGGYLKVCLCNDSVQEHPFVHHLVLKAFIGPRPVGMQCCHFDGNRANNRLTNLRWDTHRANMDDRSRHGTQPKLVGERNGMSKLTHAKVQEIREQLAAGQSLQKIASASGVSKSTVFKIRTGKTWKHVSEVA